MNIHAITCTRAPITKNPLNNLMDQDKTRKIHTCFTNRDTKHPPSSKECTYTSAIVDTGASTNLISSKLGSHLFNTHTSSACIQGFEGSTEIKGGVFGTGHMYIVSPNKHQQGFQLTTSFDTVANLNSNLFSIASLYEDHGFSLILRNRKTNNGKCELTRSEPKGENAQSIPIHYDGEKSAFMINFVIGKDRNLVIKTGKEIERRLGLSSKEHISNSATRALCPSKITKTGVILFASTQVKAISHDVSCEETVSIHHDMEINHSNQYIPTSFSTPHHMHAINYHNLMPEPEIPRREPHIPTQEEWNEHLFTETDATILGTKAGMKHREKKMTNLELHMRHGHIGNHDGKCIICNLLKGSFRRIYDKTSPYIEQRVGHSFCGDVITWSDRSRQGNKYTMVLRDLCSGIFFLIHVSRRNELTRKIEKLVVDARRNPMFQDLKRPIITSLKLDPAGEWRDDNKEFQAMATRIGLHVTYSSPDDKRSHAHGENAVKQIEITARSILLNRALPTIFIEDACNQAAMVRNLYPMAKDCVSGDGDAPRPLERITGGKISRREIDNRLHHLIPIGTPCLIYQPKNKGSNLQVPKARWGVSIKMDKDMPIFFCPFRGTGTKFRSKNYIEYTLGVGINFYKFLGLEEPPLPNIAIPSPRDQNINITTITQIDNFQDLIGSTTYGPPPIQEVRDPSLATKPLVKITDQHGWIYEHDESGDIHRTNQKISSNMEPEGEIPPTPNESPPTQEHEGEKSESTQDPNPIIKGSVEINVPENISPRVERQRPLEERLENSPLEFVGETFFKTFDGFSKNSSKV